MNYDALKYSYPSRRSVVYGRRGMVCTSQPLAAQAGLNIIKVGGNAIDAATGTCSGGHEISVLPENITFGRGQIIWRDKDGVLCGATEPRADGVVAAW